MNSAPSASSASAAASASASVPLPASSASVSPALVSNFDVFFLVYTYLRHHFPSSAISLERESKHFNLPLNELCAVHKPLSLYAILNDYCRLKQSELERERAAAHHGPAMRQAVKEWLACLETLQRIPAQEDGPVPERMRDRPVQSPRSVAAVSSGLVDSSRSVVPVAHSHSHSHSSSSQLAVPLVDSSSFLPVTAPSNIPHPSVSAPSVAASSGSILPRATSMIGLQLDDYTARSNHTRFDSAIHPADSDAAFSSPSAIIPSSMQFFNGSLNIDIDTLGLEQLLSSSIPGLIAEKINHLESLKERPNENAQQIRLTEREIEELSMQLISDPVAAPLIDQAFMFQTDKENEAAQSSSIEQQIASPPRTHRTPRKRGQSATPANANRSLTRSHSPAVSRALASSMTSSSAEPSSIEELIKRFKSGHSASSRPG